MTSLAIPPMCSPYAHNSGQPNREDILVSDDVAVMDEECFNKLLVYGHSYPSDVYSGKMWRTLVGTKWVLRWWSDEFEHNGNMVCSVEQRPIQIMNWKALMGLENENE